MKEQSPVSPEKPDFEKEAIEFVSKYELENDNVLGPAVAAGFLNGASHGYDQGYADGRKEDLSEVADQITLAMEREKEAAEEHHPTGFYLGLERALQIVNEMI